MKTYKKSEGLEVKFFNQDHDKAPFSQEGVTKDQDLKPVVKISPNVKK